MAFIPLKPYIFAAPGGKKNPGKKSASKPLKLLGIISEDALKQ